MRYANQEKYVFFIERMNSTGRQCVTCCLRKLFSRPPLNSDLAQEPVYQIKQNALLMQMVLNVAISQRDLQRLIFKETCFRHIAFA
jgi:hypothetical protein